MIPDGIYRIYKLRHDDIGETHRRLAARLHFQEGNCIHLEDHGSIDAMFPEGRVSPLMERRFMQLKHSGYFEVIHESDIAAGHHHSEVEDLDVGEVEAEHKFIMTGEGLSNPAHVEIWDDIIEVDGRQLDEGEAHHLLDEVRHGRLHLQPI